MVLSNPLKRKPRRLKLLQKQKQIQNAKQSVVIHLAPAKRRATRRPKQGKTIAEARGAPTMVNISSQYRYPSVASQMPTGVSYVIEPLESLAQREQSVQGRIIPLSNQSINAMRENRLKSLHAQATNNGNGFDAPVQNNYSASGASTDLPTSGDNDMVLANPMAEVASQPIPETPSAFGRRIEPSTPEPFVPPPPEISRVGRMTDVRKGEIAGVSQEDIKARRRNPFSDVLKDIGSAKKKPLSEKQLAGFDALSPLRTGSVSGQSEGGTTTASSSTKVYSMKPIGGGMQGAFNRMLENPFFKDRQRVEKEQDDYEKKNPFK